MVHQLSLVSTIPHSKYVQTEATLQAFTGLLSPQPISTYTLITKPNHIFKPKFEPGKVNQIEQYFMKCITTWDNEACKLIVISQPVLKDSAIFVEKLFNSSSPERIWTLQISDIPIAGKSQACCAQTIYESTLVHTHTNVPNSHLSQPIESNESKASNDSKLNEAQSNGSKSNESEQNDKDSKIKTDDMDIDIIEVDKKDTNEVSVKTEEPVDVDLIMEITEEDIKNDTKLEAKVDEKPELVQETKTLEPSVKVEQIKLEKQAPFDAPRNDSFLQFLSDLGYDVINQYWIKGVRFFYGDIVIEIYKVFIRDDDYVGEEIKLKLLDESNTFQFKAYINIAKSTNVDAINQGTKNLIKLQEMLANLLKLEIPDRMFMDSRIQVRK